MDSPVTVTEAKAGIDAAVGSVMFRLRVLDSVLENLAAASVFNKAQHAEKAVRETRSIIGSLALAVDGLVSENAILFAKCQEMERQLERINNIGVIKNG